MKEKIIKVFYDNNGLPYKDKELTTHFPIVGSGFLGASNTTKIRFYFENIGAALNDTYLAVSKLPNGKQGSQLLNIKSSDENGQYAELSLSEWYFQAKGDVFVGLKVYRGGVDVTVDDETGFSIVSGDPVIMVTGSIKLAINYAPIGDVPDYRDEFTAYNDILALMGEKPDIDTVPLLVNFSDYATWGALYEYVGTRPFVAYVNGVLSVCAIESEDSAYKLLVNNSTGIFRTSTFALDSAISISLTQIELKTDNCVELTGSSGTLTDEQVQLINKNNAYIRLGNWNYIKIRSQTNLGSHKFACYDFGQNAISGYITLTIYAISITNTNQWQRNVYPLTTYAKSQIDSLVSGLETKINASGHSLSATIDNQTYVMTIALKDKNNNVISTQQVDLPLESIVTSATYYDEYSYGGVDYEKVIVIVLATTPVPTIVPVGALVEGLITEETLDTTLKGYVKDVEITSVKTVAEVLEEIGGNNHIFSFDLMGIKYLGLFVEGQGTDIDLELWSPSGTSKVASIDTTQLFRNEMSNAVVESSYFPIISLSNPITTLSDEQMTILGQDNSVISYGGRIYVKSNESDSFIGFTCPNIEDSTSGSGYNNHNKYQVTVNKSTKDTNVITVHREYYDKTRTDTLLGNKQNTLVSGQNIKTINNESLLGSGNINVSASAEWGSIGGDIQDQTDLQNELQDIREVAEGKCKTWVLSYDKEEPTQQTFVANRYKRASDGTPIATWQDFIEYTINHYGYFANREFYSQDSFINLTNCFIITVDNFVVRTHIDISAGFDYVTDIKDGDIFLVIETNVPDRWIGDIGEQTCEAYKLETSKIDLTNYATKSEVNAKSDLTNVAPTYDSTLTYTIGEVVINPSGKLVKANTNISTPETYDSTHWDIASVASDYVNLTGTQTITGEKIFIGTSLKIKNDTNNTDFYVSCGNDGNKYIFLNSQPKYVLTNSAFYSFTTNSYDLGSSSNAWKDLYLGGKIYFGTGDIHYANNNFYLNLNGNNKYLFSSISFQPNGSANNGTIDLGDSYRRWKDLYLSGNISDGTNSVTVADISNGLFNVIDASDIVNNTLTQAQYDLITNGRPTLIKGSLLGFDTLILYPSTLSSGEYSAKLIGTNGLETTEGVYRIIESTKVISYNSNLSRLKLTNIDRINNKAIPAYPSNTGTFVLKCVNGTLTWVAEWYGTQAQYDALGTYDSNTIYNILES